MVETDLVRLRTVSEAALKPPTPCDTCGRQHGTPESYREWEMLVGPGEVLYLLDQLEALVTETRVAASFFDPSDPILTGVRRALARVGGSESEVTE